MEGPFGILFGVMFTVIPLIFIVVGARMVYMALFPKRPVTDGRETIARVIEKYRTETTRRVGKRSLPAVRSVVKYAYSVGAQQHEGEFSYLSRNIGNDTRRDAVYDSAEQGGSIAIRYDERRPSRSSLRDEPVDPVNPLARFGKILLGLFIICFPLIHLSIGLTILFGMLQGQPMDNAMENVGDMMQRFFGD